MSLLAAAVPVAVLVLAWDETTPAVRALVEVTETPAPALDSVVVLVPAAAGELTPEEFLPLAVAPPPPVAAPRVESPQKQEVDAKEAMAVGALSSPAAPVLSTANISLTAPAAPTTAATAPLAWSAVRVLHLSSFNLSELTELSSQALPRPIWQSSVVPPAAPYLGSQTEVADSQPDTAVNPVPAQPVPAGPMPAPDYLATAPLPAFDAEADLAPTLPNELATRADAPLEAPLAQAPGNAQSGWFEALASLRDPLPIEEPTPATDLEDEATYYAATAGEPRRPAGAGLAELRPPSQPFEAPNLNFQVIQYARFAVPVALAQLPFAAIYAPAWPTWLAAQELRQRTRQPLVLHVATLAVGADSSLETATGWQAELQRQALHRADLILAETPALTQRLRHDLGLPPERVRTVPAADADAVAQALRTAQLRSNAGVR